MPSDQVVQNSTRVPLLDLILHLSLNLNLNLNVNLNLSHVAIEGSLWLCHIVPDTRSKVQGAAFCLDLRLLLSEAPSP